MVPLFIIPGAGVRNAIRWYAMYHALMLSLAYRLYWNKLNVLLVPSNGLRSMNRFRPLLCIGLAIVYGTGLPGCGDQGRHEQVPAVPSEAAYMGVAACVDCHSEQVALWRGSHHELAMQPASEMSVLGAFNNTEFSHNGITSRFYTRDGGYFIETDGLDGQLDEFPVRYTFGVEPLQKYLLELPGGRIQTLGASWDSRPGGEGGQRWFHVYGDQAIHHTDVLHWTRLGQNWDSMCAYCHSTGLKKTFKPETNTFNTSWAEINVACEACHGPGSLHVEWAASEAREYDQTANGDKGFAAQLNERDGVSWIADPGSGNSRRNRPRLTQVETSTCAACHSRRSQIEVMPMPGSELLDGFRPALIQPPLYYVDGQIRGEVYVWGSFLQSRMYQQGVTCSDCHEPHSLKLRASGSAVCLQCHAAEKFAASEHHLHPLESAGADCIECHMPSTTYMQVDPRHDHSFRVPRPDLSMKFSTPDVCTNCHDDRNAEWATDVLREQGRLNDADHWQKDFATILSAQDGAWALIPELAADKTVPAIVRASVIVQAPLFGNALLMQEIVRQAVSEESLIRWAVARALQGASASMIASHATPLLEDPVRAVRIAAASALAPVALELLPAHTQRILQEVLDEYLLAEQVNNERAEAHTNIGNLQRRLRRPESSEQAYQTALDLNPFFVPAYVNLADLYRQQGDEAAGEMLLREAIVKLPGQPALHYSLGLSLVRQDRTAEAQVELQLAAAAQDADARMALAYALILEKQGKTDEAINYLNASLERFGDVPLLRSMLNNLR